MLRKYGVIKDTAQSAHAEVGRGHLVQDLQPLSDGEVEELDAARAGHRVGYEDPAYFSRDYKKRCGAPPHRDIARFRGNLEPGGAVANVKAV